MFLVSIFPLLHSWFDSESEEKDSETTDKFTETTIDNINKFEIVASPEPEPPEEDLLSLMHACATIESAGGQVTPPETVQNCQEKLQKWRLDAVLSGLGISVLDAGEVDQLTQTRIDQVRENNRHHSGLWENLRKLKVFFTGYALLMVVLISELLFNFIKPTSPWSGWFSIGIMVGVLILLFVSLFESFSASSPIIWVGRKELSLDNYGNKLPGRVKSMVSDITETLPEVETKIIVIEGSTERFMKAYFANAERYIAGWNTDEEGQD